MNYLQDKIKEITVGEVEELFMDEFEIDIRYYSSCDLPYMNNENENFEIQKIVDSYGGEGLGEEYWTISRVIDKNTGEVFFIKFDAYYNSWNGEDWSENDWSIVKPTEVKVMQWL